MDNLTPEQRSSAMSKVGVKHTKPEIKVRKLLHAMGFRFRLHRKDLPGKPDIVLPKWSVVVFVHGCFWHGHHCPRGGLPTTNPGFWREKIRKNQERDSSTARRLRELGWGVITVWECELKHPETLETKLRRIAAGHESNDDD